MTSSGIDRIQFNPAARPVDTVGIDASFQRMAAPVNTAPQVQAPTPLTPPPRPADNTGNAQALIAALSNFGGVAKAFLDERDEDRRQADVISGQFAAMHRSERSWAEAVQNDPSLASNSPWFKKAFTESIIKTSVSKRVGQLQAEYATSDIANSTDPGAIQAWYLERMKDTLSAYTDPDSRKAALEVAREAAEKFAAAHAKNATANLLVQADKAGAQGFSETLDALSASPGSIPANDPGVIALKDATPAQRAFLAAVASGESAGKYNIRFGGVGSSPKSFDISSPHPGIMEPGPEGPSSAAGKYQFTITTWKGMWNGANPVMSPENQDKAALALAQQDYKARTGRDLWEDIEKNGFTRSIQSVLAPTWTSFRGGQERRSALFNQVLQRSGGQVAEAPTARPDFDAAQSNLYRDRDALVSGGQNIERVNNNLVQSVINMSLKTLDPTYLHMLEHEDSKGIKLSADPKVREQIIQTQSRIYSLSVTRDNQRRVLEEAQKKAQMEKLKSTAFIAMEEGYRNGNPKPFSSDLLIEAAKHSFALAEKMQAMNKALDERNKQEDPKAISDAMMKLYSGETQVADVPDLIAAGVLKDPQTINKFYEQARQNQTQSYLNSSVFRDAMSDITSVLGDPQNIDLEKAQKKVEARGEVRQKYIEFMTENPKASPMAQSQFLYETTKAVLGDKADIDAWKAQKKAAAEPAQAPKAPPGMSAPSETKNPSVGPARAPIAPSKQVDTGKVFVFGTKEALEQAFQEWRNNVGDQGPFTQWLKARGITDKKQAVQWYLQQRALAGTNM